MEWKGINQHSTPIDNRPGYALEQYNVEMITNGELRRRPGHANSSIAKQTGAILGIASAAPTHGNFLTFAVGSTLQGYGTSHGAVAVMPDPAWDVHKWRPPIGVANLAVAPVITGYNNSPVTPSPGAPGLVTFTMSITYDGLSGDLTLVYADGVAPPSFATSTAQFGNDVLYVNWTLNFNAGSYNPTIRADTALNGFQSNAFPCPFTVM